jgi:CPA2 family monovalent cation:H+ antiporter-2
MNDIAGFLQDFTLVLCVAAVTTLIFHWLKQPTVLGYLLAGLILGPHVNIPLSADEGTVKTLAELGVILVMFHIGLKFSIRRLIRVIPTAGLTSLIEISVMMWLGYSAAELMGWTPLESIFTGAIVSMSSTMIASKALMDSHQDEKLTRGVFGVMVVQDLVAVLLVAVLTPLAAGAKLSFTNLLITSGSLLGFLGVLFLIGYLLIPFVVRQVVRLQNPETLLVTTVGLCFAMALLAQKGGYSVALGAFLAGMLMAEAGYAPEVERLINPLKDIFAAVFFVAVGMLVNPAVLAEHWRAVLALTLVVILGQVFSVTLGSFLSGRPLNIALRTAMSLAQIGEFSYIIAQVGIAHGNVGAYIYDVAVAVSVVTAFTTPWLIRLSDPLASLLDSRLPKPLQTFITLYGSWLEGLRHGGGEETIWNKSRRLVRKLATDGFFLAVIVITTAATIKKWVPDLQQYINLSVLGWRILLVSVGLALSLPFMVGVFRCARMLAGLIANSAIPMVATGVLDLGQAPRKVLSITLQMGILFAMGFPLMALTQPFLPSGYSPALFAVALSLFGVFFWKSAVNLHEHVQAGAQMVTQAISHREPEKREAVMEQVNTMVPGIGAPQSIPIGSDSSAIGRSLADLNLRGNTGASVIALMRGEERYLMPGGRDIVQAGDILVLVGTHQAIKDAKELIRKS